MKKQGNKIAFFVALLLFLLAGAGFVLAQDLETEYPEISGYNPETVASGLPEYVRYVFNFSIWVVGAVAFGALIVGGILFITSAGDPGKSRAARSQITAAFLGIIILAGSYFILYTVNPQLIVLKAPVLELAEIEEAEEFDLATVTTSINVELPVETRIRGAGGSTYGIFEELRLEAIKEIADETVNTAQSSIEPSEELDELTGRCTCGTSCVNPVCIGSCCCQIVCDEESCWCESCSCGSCGCSSDPCCKVRSEVTAQEDILQQKLHALVELQTKTNKQIRDLQLEIDKLRKALTIMAEDCQLWGVLSRDQFISNKDYYEQRGWELTKILYFDEVTALAPNSSADFYCPVGGNQSAYIPEPEISYEDLEEAAEAFEEYLAEGGVYETVVSCSNPIPLGEIVDKGIVLAKSFIQKLEELLELNEQETEAIDYLNNLVNECTSDNCSCSCSCNGLDDCTCKPSPRSNPRCSGNPCPDGIRKAVREIEDLAEKIAEKRDEIEEFIDGDIARYLLLFDAMGTEFHSCIAEPEQIEPGWMLLDCERAIGTIGPDKEVLGLEEGKEECPCSESEECDDKYGSMLYGEYDGELYEGCQEIENCHYYNFYCCRIKD